MPHQHRSFPPTPAIARTVHPDDVPLAYFISITCYGTWLHGDQRGSIDRRHNLHGTAVLAADPAREHWSVNG